jgi:hypothetical protein
MTTKLGDGVYELTAEATQFFSVVAKASEVARKYETDVVRASGNANAALAGIGKDSEKSSTQVETASKRVTSSLQREAAQAILTQQGYAAYRAEIAGLTQQQYGPYIEAIGRAVAAKKAEAEANAKAAAELKAQARVQAEIAATQRASAQEAARYANNLGLVGVTAKGTSAALRQLPAQFTDIFTSLAGGQNPLLVFLQQGGQIKDQFGGIGNAAKALATAITPLSVGLTASGAAVGVVTFAAISGARELTAFRRALVLSGNATGETVAGLNATAAAVSGVVGTQGKAAEVLAALASTGRVAAKDLTLLAEAAIRLEKEGGPAVEETVKQFAELGKSPTQAAAKLNESTRFLTLALYEQIKTLENQGRTAEAASIAQQAYATKSIERTKELEANLGTLERGWRTLGTAAKSAWDSILDIGRTGAGQNNPADQLAKAEKALASLRARQAAGEDLSKPQAANNALLGQGAAAIESQIRSYERLVATLKNAAESAQLLTEAQKAAAVAAEAAVKFSDLQDKFKTPQARLQDDLARAREAASGVRGGILAGARTDSQIQGAKAQLEAIDAQAKQLLGNIAVYSEAAQLSVAQRLARIAAEAATAVEALAGRVQAVQSKAASGVLNEYEAIEQLAALQVEAAKAEERRIAAVIDATPKIIQNREKVIALEGQLQVQIQRTANIENKASSDVEAARNKRAVSAAQALFAEQQLAQEQRDAFDREYTGKLNASAEAIRQYGLGLQDAAFAHQEELAASVLGDRAREIRLKQLQIELETRRRIRELEARGLSGDDLAAARERILTQAAEASRAAAEQVNQAFDSRVFVQARDAITDFILEGGKGGADKLKDLFKNLVLRPVVQAAFQPLAQSLSQTLLGSGGNVLSQASGLGGLVSGLGSLGGGISGAISGLFGNGLLAGGGAAAGVGSSGIAAGAILGDAGVTAAGAASGLGSTLATLGPYAAAAVVLYSLAKSLDKSGTPHLGSVVTADAAGVRTGGADPTGILRNLNAQTDTALKLVAGGSIAALNNLATAFGGSQFTAEAKFTADGQDPSFGAFALKRDGQQVSAIPFSGANDSKAYQSDRDKAFQDYSLDVAKTVRTALDQINLPQWAKDQINALGDGADLDKLAALTKSIGDTQKAFGAFRDELAPFGGAFATIASLSSDALFSLSGFAGGFDQLRAGVGAFYQEFYSEQEQAAMSTAALTKTLAGVGLAVPETREAFRALVEQQLSLGDSGLKAAATLLNVSGAFAELNPVLETAVEQVRTAAEIARERSQLEDELLRLQGDTTVIRQRELAALDPTNRAIQERIFALQDEATAATIAARVIEQVASAAQRLTSAESGVRSATQAIADFGEAIKTRIASLESSIADVRGRAAGAVDAAKDKVAQALQSMAQAAQNAANDVQRAADALRAAEGRRDGAAGSIQSSVLAQRSAVDAAKSGVASALAGLRSDADAAQRRVDELQGKTAVSANTLAEALDRLSGSLTSYLDDLLGGERSGSVAPRLDVTRAIFEDTAARAKAGDATAVEGLLDAAKRFLDASEKGSSTGAGFDADTRLVRRVLSEFKGAGGLGGAASGGDAGELSKALADLATAQGLYASAAAQAAAFGVTQAAQVSAFDASIADLTSASALLESMVSQASAAGVNVGGQATDAFTSLIEAYKTAEDDVAKASSDLAVAVVGNAQASSLLEIATAKAAASGIVLADQTKSAADFYSAFVVSLSELTAAQEVAAALGASQVVTQQTLEEEYKNLQRDLLAAREELSLFNTRVADVDFSKLKVLDPLGDLLKTYSEAVSELLEAVDKQRSQNPAGQFINAGNGFDSYRSSGGAVAVGRTGSSNLALFGIDGRTFSSGAIKEYIGGLLAAGDLATIYKEAVAFGISSADLDKLTGAGTPALAYAKALGLPAFETGSSYVPNTGLAVVHQGERIFTAADNAQLMRLFNQGNNGDLAAQIASLVQRLERMEAQRAADQQSTAVSMQRVSDTLTRIQGGGIGVYNAPGEPALKTVAA